MDIIEKSELFLDMGREKIKIPDKITLYKIIGLLLGLNGRVEFGNYAVDVERIYYKQENKYPQISTKIYKKEEGEYRCISTNIETSVSVAEFMYHAHIALNSNQLKERDKNIQCICDSN